MKLSIIFCLRLDLIHSRESYTPPVLPRIFYKSVHSYMTKVAEEVDLPIELLTRLIAGSLPYFSKSTSTSEKIFCCQFITQIMKNFCEKKTSAPFLDTVFDPLYSSLLSWQNMKTNTDLALRNKILESVAWLCHGLPWNR